MKKLIEKVWFEVVDSLKIFGSDSNDSNFNKKKGKKRKTNKNTVGNDTGMNSEKVLLEKLSDIPENRLLKAALTAVTVTGKAVLNRPGIKASLEAAKSKLLLGKGEQYRIVEEAQEQADKIALILQTKGVKADKLGVDGLPGSGKSTLARALAGRLGMQWKSLDHENMDASIDFSFDHTVYEHHRLFRTQQVDVFDAVIYIDNSIETTKVNIVRRTRSGRGGVILDVLDFEKLKNIGRLAFEICEGEQFLIPGSNVRLKVRGTDGFWARKNLLKRLRSKGHEPTGLNKEEMLFLIAYGKRQYGLKAYLLPGAFNDELFKGLLAGISKFIDD